MPESPSREPIVALGIFFLLLIVYLGFLVHSAPRFAGSAWGGAFGVTAAALMLVPLVYTLVKRVAALRRRFVQRFSLRTLLQLHVYCGLLGALLAIVHTGHKFQSTLGIALTALMLLVVVSGFIGQYYLRYVADDIREKQQDLATLWRATEQGSRSFATGPSEPPVSLTAATELLRLATSVAELQYSVQFQTRLRKLFGVWLAVHVWCSVLFYVFLALHICAAFYFGVRWFQ